MRGGGGARARRCCSAGDPPPPPPPTHAPGHAALLLDSENEPAAHVTHAPAPASDPVPELHLEHCAASVPLHVPGWHAAHMVAPAAVLAVPGLQGKHAQAPLEVATVAAVGAYDTRRLARVRLHVASGAILPLRAWQASAAGTSSGGEPKGRAQTRREESARDRRAAVASAQWGAATAGTLGGRIGGMRSCCQHKLAT